MPVPNTDLLPPLFEQVLVFFGNRQVGAHVREDIIRTLENGIVNAAAAGERERASRTSGMHQIDTGKAVVLTTSDRLSGADLSRAALVQQVQSQTQLDASLVEIALLLVEAQIDLRLKGTGRFKVSGIEFSPVEGKAGSNDADWCKAVLSATLHSATEDKPSLWSSLGRRKPAGVRVLIDTLQLSAALRDALPYVITVDRHRVDPLLAQPRDDGRIRLLHISDLHLVGDLREEGRKLARPIGTPTHSFATARAVATAVAALRPRFDLLVATGDLTTDGSRHSFETVLQYVQSGSVTGENPMRIAAYGLGASKSQRILVPGNHDRYADRLVLGQRLDDTFEQVLETPSAYPYVVGYRPHGSPKDSLTLLFFVFDSTLPEGRRGPGLGDWAESAAVGEIGAEELAKAETLAAQIARERKVDQLVGEPIEFDPAQTIRIALLHHHPVVTQGRFEVVESSGFQKLFGPATRRVWKYRDEREAKLVRMDGSERFLSTCFRSGIQIVMFGHQHYPYQRLVVAKGTSAIQTPFGTSIGAIRTYCCPTTLQHDAKGNGFYLFDFISKSEFEWTSIGSLRVNGDGLSPMAQLDRATAKLDAKPTQDEVSAAHEIEIS